MLLGKGEGPYLTLAACFYLGAIELSVSPSPRTQTSQWQSSISCTGAELGHLQVLEKRLRETLEHPKLASVLWGLCFKNGKAMCGGYL